MNSVRRWLRERSLQSSDSEARIKAIEKLGASGDTEGIPNLIGALSDATLGVRIAAAVALGQIGDDRAVDPLVELSLEEPDLGLRQEAVQTLAKIDLQRSVALYLRMLDNEDVAVRQAAGWALRKIGWDILDDAQKAHVAIVRADWEEVTEFGSAAVGPLEDVFRTGTNRNRADAVEALGQIGTEESIAALVSILNDFELDHGSRELAGRTLRRYCANDLTDPQHALICIALGEWSEIVSLGAAAVEPLVSALPHPSLSNHAARALIQIGPAGMESLVGLVKNQEVSAAVREAAAIALAEISDARAVGPLLLSLTDSDMAVRQTAVWTLERLGWQPGDDGQRAMVAIAHENWEEIRQLGAGAVEPLLCLATDGMITPEGIAALESVLESAPTDVSANQLRTLAALQSPAPAHVGASVSPEAAADKYARIVKLAKAQLFKRGIMQ